MKRNHLFFFCSFAIAVFFSLSAYAQNIPVRFRSGITAYTENGKYGFQYRERQLTPAIYDTLMMLTAEYCVAKKGKTYAILDEKLKNRFYESIEALDYHYSNELKMGTLVIQSGNRKRRVYTVTDKIELITISADRNPFIEDYYKNQNTITDSVDFAIRFPESNERIHPFFLIKDTSSAFDTILYDSHRTKLFFRHGEPVVRERRFDGFLSGALVEYVDKSNGTNFVINELTLDTILTAAVEIQCRVVNNQIRLLIPEYANRHVYGVEAFDEKGRSLYHMRMDTTDLSHESQNVLTISDGIIREEISFPRKKEKAEHKAVLNIYSILDGHQLLKNVEYCMYSGRGLDFFYSKKAGEYYVIYDGKVIRTLKLKKQYYITAVLSEYEGRAPWIVITYVHRKDGPTQRIEFSAF